jgi:hypothetical protein
MILVSYDWAWSRFTNVNIMVCDRAPFGVHNFCFHTFCYSVSGHRENVHWVSVALKTTEILYGKVGQITIYDHVQLHIATLI